MSAVTILRRFEWDSAHRIAGHEGMCKALHGHRYVAELEIGAVAMDALGRVVDFSVVKRIVGDWILANFDHTAIFDSHDDEPAVEMVKSLNERLGKPSYLLSAPPTAEVIVEELAARVAPLLAEVQVELLSIRLWETPNCSALWVRPKA